MRTVVIAYIPVLHKGYYDFLTKYRRVADRVFILGAKFIGEFDHLARKDIRALAPEKMVYAIESMMDKACDILTDEKLTAIRRSRVKHRIIMPKEEEMRQFADRYFNLTHCQVEFDDTIFLRWDRERVLAELPVMDDRRINQAGFEHEMMQLALTEAQKSTDWWRQLGAVIVRDQEPLLVSHNHHLPHPQTPNIEGDMRSLFKKGQHIELLTAQHAEAGVIAVAARDGIALKGTSIFVSTFPCPVCAKLIAEAGIAKCYYVSGYAMADGERVLRDANVEIIGVDLVAEPIPS